MTTDNAIESPTTRWSRMLGALPTEGLQALAVQVQAQLELRHLPEAALACSPSSEHERMSAMLVQQTSHFLQMAGRSAQFGGWVVELPSRRVLWSDEVAAIYEQTSGALYEWGDAVSHYRPEWRDKFMQVFDYCVRDGTPFDEDLEITTSKGRRVWVRTIGQALRDPSGSIIGVLGATQDIMKVRKVEEDARRLATRLAITLESITDAFFALDHDWRFTFLNREAERLLQQPREQLLGEMVWAGFCKVVESAVGRPGEPAPDSNTPLEFEQFYEPTGLWFEVRAYPSEDGFAVYVRDITGRRKAQEQLKLLEMGVSRLNDLVLITEAAEDGSSDQRIVFVNDAFARLTGYDREEVLGQTLQLLRGPKTQRSALECISDALATGQPVRTEFINYKKDRGEFWIDLDLVPVVNTADQVSHWVAVGRDVTQRKAAEDRIHHLAFYDPLTQLPNRLVLMERLKLALAAHVKEGGCGALMFIDLDNFKILNDTMGHDKGDLLLRQVAKRLTASVGKSHTVARLGGDEFVVMLEGWAKTRIWPPPPPLSVLARYWRLLQYPTSWLAVSISAPAVSA